jgi:hypothetical protein
MPATHPSAKNYSHAPISFKFSPPTYQLEMPDNQPNQLKMPAKHPSAENFRHPPSIS